MLKALLLSVLVLVGCVSAPDGVVPITLHLNGQEMYATGTVIHSSPERGTYILTAGHIMGPTQPLPPWRGASWDVDGRPAQFVAYELSVTDMGPSDIGVLRLPKSGRDAVAIGRVDLQDYPDLMVRTLRGEKTATLKGGRLSMRPNVVPGDSGSGVFLADTLCGVVAAIDGDDEALFIRYRVLAAFLDANGLDWLLLASD